MQVGKYVLRRPLGLGGYAHVFAAHDPSLDREIALKLLKPEHSTSEVVVRRFLQEAHATVKVSHPGIVTVFECGEAFGADGADETDETEDGTAYIAMELLDGETLADRIERCGILSAAAVIELGRQLASALEAAHRAGIVHRDLKPENVFLVEDPLAPGGERAKVLDFGIAKLGRSLRMPGMHTGSLQVLGTPRYMSPEQCRSAGRLDHRTDIYALGAMLFELLAGRPPFEGQAVEVIAQHLTLTPPSLLEFVPEAPPALAALIAQLMEKEPDARPASMEAVERALETIAQAAGITPPPRPSSIPGLPGMLSPLWLATARPTAEPSRIGPASALRALGEAPTMLAPRPPVPRELATRELVTTEPMARRGAGSRRVAYAAASLFMFAASLGAYLLLRGPGVPQVPTAMAQVERTERPSVPPSEPAMAAATTTHDVAPVPEEAAETATEPTPRASTATETVEPADARARAADPDARLAGGRAKPAAVRARPAAPAARSFGVLALTSKPECEIYVDGRATGARTPLRELKLPAGKHRITLRNSEHAIQDSFAVVIGAGVTERVAKDYSGQIKREARQPRGPRDTRDDTINPFADGDP